MILHSVAPLEYLLPQETDFREEEVPVLGAVLCGRRTPQGLMITRLISTNPADYLNDRFAPGSLYPFPAKEDGEDSEAGQTGRL